MRVYAGHGSRDRQEGRTLSLSSTTIERKSTNYYFSAFPPFRVGDRAEWTGDDDDDDDAGDGVGRWLVDYTLENAKILQFSM